MTVSIPSNRIGGLAGAANQPGRRRSETQEPFAAPPRAHVNSVPGPESLQALVRSAVAALRSGVYWDRGTILNLLV